MFGEGRATAFPWEAAGGVSIDDLTERARNNCPSARTVLGRDFGHRGVVRTREANDPSTRR